MSSMFGNSENQSQSTYPISTSNSDIFGAIGTAKPREGAPYIIPGLYPILYIDALKIIKARAGDTLAIAEFTILKSTVAGRLAGSSMNWLCNFRHDATAGNIRSFLAAVMDVSVDEVDAEGAKYAYSESNPCCGRLVRCEATEIITKVNQTPFTVCRWTSIPKDIQEKANSLKSELLQMPF